MAYANSADPDQTLFVSPLSILRNNCLKSKIETKKYGINCSNVLDIYHSKFEEQLKAFSFTDFLY